MKPLQKDQIEFDAFNQDVGRVIKVRRTGRLFTVAGVDVALFPIGVLCEAIERDPRTIRRWEKEGTWPKPQWRVPDDRCKRWYSKLQIEAIHTIYHECSNGERGFSHSPHFPLAEFFNKVQAVFYKVDAEAVARKDADNAEPGRG